MCAITGEASTPQMREEIRRCLRELGALGTTVFDRYGSTELGAFAQCREEGEWHNPAPEIQYHEIVDPETGQRTVVLAPSAGIFWDRDGSLLASLLVRAGRTEAATLNVHPGVVRIAGYSPGLWAQWLRSRQLRVGLATELGLGVGVGPR